MIDILIGHDRRLFVDLVSSVLAERGFGVVEGVGDPESLLADVRRRRPRLCLVDRRFLSGRHDLADLVAAASEGGTRIVVVGTGAVAETADALGVDGVLDRRAGLECLLDGVSRVLGGEVVTITPARTGRRAPDDAAWIRRQAASLTPRERECLALLVEGMTSAQIERTLSISVMTVRSHVRSLLAKLGAHSRLEAAALAVRHELLVDGPGASSRAG